MTLPIPGVDYSVARPTGAALKAAGKKFACRYLAYSHPSLDAEAKFLTAAEVKDLHDHGIDIVANFESTADRSYTAGSVGGFADGTDARVAMEDLRFPTGSSCYVSLQDHGLTAAEYLSVLAYAQGFARGLGSDFRMDYYGGSILWAWLRAHGFPDLRLWQAGALSWSGYLWSPLAVIQQQGFGISVSGTDGDRALVSDFGQWPAPGGFDMLAIVTETPFAGGPRAISLNGTVNGYDPARPDTIVRSGSLVNSGAHASASVSVAWPGVAAAPAPNGPGFLRVVDGVFAGLLIPSGGVSVAGGPKVLTQADVDAAVSAAVGPLQTKIAAAKSALA